jgi:DNA-binding transcriptional regulator PaaX
MAHRYAFDEKSGSIKKKIKVAETVADVSFGVLNKLCDLVLLDIFLFGAALESGGIATKFSTKVARFVEDYPSVDVKQWLNSFTNIKRKKWLDGDQLLTDEGKRRLQSLLPVIMSSRSWDGNWYIVIFDILEELKAQRDVLREFLERLGFGKLQNSVWISPFPFLGTVQGKVEGNGLERFVLCLQSSMLGEESSQELARRVWRLDLLEKRYEEFLKTIAHQKKNKKLSPRTVLFWYASIAKEDPQLPSELLPKHWPGNEAHTYMKRFAERYPTLKKLFG